MLRQIRKFLRNRPNNVLLIDNEDYIRPADFARAVERSGLIDFVYRGPTDEWPTLRQMITLAPAGRDARRQRRRRLRLVPPDLPGDPAGDAVHLPEPATSSRDPANWEQSCGPNRGDVTGSMFLMNHWSPPTAPPQPDLEKSAEVNARGVLVGRAQKCAEVRGRLPSLIAADQITAGDLIGAVRDLNAIAAQTPGP